MIVEVSVSLWESVLWVVFQNLFHGSMKNRRSQIIGGTITAICLSVNVLLADHFVVYSSYTFLVDFFILMLYSLHSLEGQWYWKVFTILLYNICIAATSFFSLALFENGFHISVNELALPGGIWRVPFLLSSKVFLTMLVYAVMKERRRLETKKKGTVAFLIFPVLTIYIISILMELFGEYYLVSGDMEMIVMLVVAISVLLGCGLYMQWNAFEGKREEMENRMLHQRLEFQEETYIQMQEYIRACRKIQHDMKHRLILVEQLMFQGEYKKGELYLRKYLEELDGIQKLTVSDNVWKTVLAIKKTKAEEKNILFHADIQEQGMQGIEENDLCMLLGNLLDNAVEAEERLLQDREIRLCMREEFGVIFIKAENRIKESVLQNNHRFRSSKKDAGLHGLGMACIREIIQKYNGSIQWEEEDSWLRIEIVLLDLIKK